MAKSSIADRYLRTLETNAIENTPKSPPKSLRSPEKSPAKSASPMRSPTRSPLKSTEMNQTEFQTYEIAPKRSIEESGTPTSSALKARPIKSSPIKKTAPASPTKSILSKSSPVEVSPVKTSPVKASPVKASATSPVKDVLKASVVKALVSPLKGPAKIEKPDRHLLMHNQDLTPSQVSWDSERKNWQAYEYLCHVVEAKEWMEKILGESLPPAEQFPESLQNGIALAKIVQKLQPELMEWPVFEHKRLQYRHTENITLFFDLLEKLKIPQLFTFDMTDLYEKRNLPKVIYCIHAISHYIAESDFAVAAVDNLVGKLEFSDNQLLTTERGLKGHAIPNFGAMTRQLSGKQPELEGVVDYDDESDAAIVIPKASKAELKERKVSIHEDAIFDDSTTRTATFSDDEGDEVLDIVPPRRYRRNYDDSIDDSYSKYRDFSSRQSSISRYSQYDRRSYDRSYDRRYERSRYDSGRGGRGYRNLSSTGSLRSKVLSAAELMLMELEELEPEIMGLQAACRGFLWRKKPKSWLCSDEASKLATQLQAAGRGTLYRCRKDEKLPDLSASEEQCLVGLQSLVRASFARRHFRATAMGANNVTHFQSLARGVLERRKTALQSLRIDTDKDARKAILALQSKFRGVIVRFHLGCLYDDLESETPKLTALQAACRGLLIRRNNSVSKETWERNVDKIVLIQSVWRAFSQGSRYRTLIADSNPSLQTIKPFLHLYEANDKDYQEEVELEEILREISKNLKQNDQLEARIDQLDMKIALLVKNDISIDEMLLQQQRQNQDLKQQLQQDRQLSRDYDTTKTYRKDHSSGLKDLFDIKSLQKPSRERFELYQGLLYILQTQPIYLSKLMNLTSLPRSLDMPDLVMAVFGKAQTMREQFYLLKQLTLSITQSTVGSAENTAAWCIVSLLNKTPDSMAIAVEILKPATKKLKARSEQVLEYDPHLIYENLTGGADLCAEDAIQDPAVRALFVQNLRWLREVTQAIVQSLATNVHKLPYHLRYLGREVYREVLRFTHDRVEAMAAVGQVIISQYIQPMLLAADNLDLVDSAVGYTAKNLVLVCRVIHQVGLMVPLDAETAHSTDIYLRPLNEFIKSSSHQLSLQFQSAVVECADLQEYFNLSEFDDITMYDRPVLEITMENLLALHYLCYNHVSTITAESDNTLKPLIQKLGPLPKDSREMLDLARFKEMKLELNPKYCAASLSSSMNGTSSLLATTKRCLVYVLRVQNSQPDLMSVLVAPVELEDEHRYNLLLDTDNNREMAGELSNLTFRELKLLTLEKVLELESSGAVSRDNDYQALINAIANDIRNKDSVRHKRLLNLEMKRGALRSIEEKSTYLHQRLQTYNQHIDDAMRTLQLKALESQQYNNSNKRFQFQLPGSTKLSLDHSGCSQFGQYRTNADKLYERGVLIRLWGYTDRQRKDVHITFSCDKVAVFQMDVKYKGTLLPNGHAEVTLDDLLAHQYQNEQHLEFVGGDLQFSTNRLLQLILSKFLNLQQ